MIKGTRKRKEGHLNAFQSVDDEILSREAKER
jgi:hypothetical protein